VPRNSELLRKVCVILMLLEALKTQRTDLKPVPLRSLVRSVSPSVSQLSSSRRRLSTATRDIFGVAEVDPLDVIPEALIRAADLRPLPLDDADADPQTIIQRFQVEGLQMAELAASFPPPIPPLPIALARRTRGVRGSKGILSILARRGIAAVKDPQVREIACGIAAPFLIRFAITPDPRVSVPALLAAAACGFELVED